MKQLINNLVQFNFQGIEWDTIEKIEFAFSQTIDGCVVKTSTYPGDAKKIAENVIGVPWTAEETTCLKENACFYADTRITLKDSDYQPETSIVKLRMNPTLFEEV